MLNSSIAAERILLHSLQSATLHQGMHCHLQLEIGRTMQHPQNGQPLKAYLHAAITLLSIARELAMDPWSGPDGYGNDAAEQCIDGICSNVLLF